MQMHKLIKNGHKKLMAIVLFVGFGANQCFAGLPVIDPTNLVQNTITAIQQIASYSKQLSDSIRQLREFDKHAVEFTNETLGLNDLLGDINSISSDISDIYKAKEDMDELLKDPQSLFDDQYKKYTDNYNLYDKCKGLKEEALNICLRDKINYAAGIKQHRDYENLIYKLQTQLNKQVKRFNEASSQKDRENAALAIRATQAQMEKVKSFNELESIEYRNHQRVVAEQQKELFKKSIATRYSVAEKYKNVGKEDIE